MKVLSDKFIERFEDLEKQLQKLSAATRPDSVLIERYSEITGMKINAIRHQISAHWTEGVEYANDGGRIWVNIKAVEKRRWKELRQEENQSGSSSDTGSSKLTSVPRKRTSKHLADKDSKSKQDGKRGKISLI